MDGLDKKHLDLGVLLKKFSENSIEVDRNEGTIESNISSLKDLGFIDILSSHDLGGGKRLLSVISPMIQKTAVACGSTAWNYSIFASHSWMLCSFPDKIQELIYKDKVPPLLATGLFMQPNSGGLEKVGPGSYRLSGAWNSVSGITQAEWLAVGVMTEDKQSTWVFIPTKDVSIIKDSWDMSGLRGTLSYDVELKNVHVSENQMVTFQEKHESTIEKYEPSSLYSLPMSAIISVMGTSLALGLVKGALSIYQARVNSYKEAPRSVNARNRLVQFDLELSACQALLEQSVHALETPDIYLKNAAYFAQRTLAVASHITSRCHEVMTKISADIGTGNLSYQKKFQLYFRDLTAVVSHYYFNQDNAFNNYSKFLR